MKNLLQFGRKKDSLFFRTDEDGHNLFYPWAYPGEAFILSEKQKLFLEIIFITLSVTIFVVCIGYIYFDSNNYIKAQTSDYVISIFIMAYTTMYFIFVLLISKSTKFHIVSQTERPAKKRIIILAIVIFSSQMIGIIAPIAEWSLVFTTISGVYLFFIFYALYKLHKTKGYFFTG
jgi:hypothetical protein